MNESELAMCYLQNAVHSSKRGTVASAETHRLSVLSNLQNALCHGEFTEAQTKRIKRMVKTLEGTASDPAGRKFDVVQAVISGLISLGLAEAE